MSRKPRSSTDKVQEVSLLAAEADDFYNSLIRSRPSFVPPGIGDRALQYLVCSLIMTDSAPYWNNAQTCLESQVAVGGGQ